MAVRTPKAIVRRILRWQIVTIAFVTASALGFWGTSEAKFSLLGGLIALLPNALFAAIFAYPVDGRGARSVLASFYLGEVIKLITTGILFFLVFQLSNVLVLPLMAGFISPLLIFWLALLLKDNAIKGS